VWGGVVLDLDANGGVAGFAGASINPVFELGRLPGAPFVNELERVVGGQLVNVFNLNPDIDQSTTLTLFTTELTIDDAAPHGSQVTVDANAAAGAGIVLFEDATSGASIRFEDVDIRTLRFARLTIDIVSDCLGDTNGDSVVNIDDLLFVRGAFGNTGVGSPAGGDFDGDGDVTIDDLLIVLGEFGNDCR